MISRARINGRLTRTCEVKDIKGTTIVNFSVASNSRRKVKGNWEDYTSYFDCVMYGDRANAVSKYLLKGQLVSIDGLLLQDRWEDANGKKCSRIFVEVGDIDLMGAKSERTERKEEPKPSGGPEDFEDDIPF